jgi:hypothetical protein
MTDAKSSTLYEGLDTSFVNLWALLRFLSQRGFVGRVHVELKDYTADVLLDGSSTPLVREVDHATGTSAIEEAALHRLVLRVRESPGSISVYEGLNHAEPAVKPARSDSPVEADVITFADDTLPRFIEAEPKLTTAIGAGIEASSLSASGAAIAAPTAPRAETEAESDWDVVVHTSGDLIGAVERALTGAGVDFASRFRAARLEVADDYSFLDPTNNGFDYSRSEVNLHTHPSTAAYVAGISEVLRRTVDQVATGERTRRVRERVALEMAILARKYEIALARSGFGPRLDRIAGTRVV